MRKPQNFYDSGGDGQEKPAVRGKDGKAYQPEVSGQQCRFQEDEDRPVCRAAARRRGRIPTRIVYDYDLHRGIYRGGRGS